MNPTAFISLLTRDNPSKFKDYKQLDRLLRDHPYFQIGLAAKSRYLKAKQHIDFIKVSRKTTVIFPNRSKLYHYLNIEDKPVKDDTGIKIVETVDADDLKTRKEDLPSEKSAPVDAPETIPPKPDPISELEKNYLVEAINQSIQLEAVESPPEEIEKEKAGETKQVLSFSDWISGKPETTSGSFSNKLIDHFINEDPVITRVHQKEFYSAVEKGKESIDESNLPISETLAAIFAQQGNKTMAIKGYEKLMLKYPEKSIYFAGLIKKLKEK